MPWLRNNSTATMASQLQANRISRLNVLRSQAMALRGPLGLLLSRTYDIIRTVVENGVEDVATVGYALESLESERELAMRRDPQRDDPIHNVIYEFTGTLGVMIDTIVEDRKMGIEYEQAQMDVMGDLLPDFVVPKREDEDVITLDDDEPRALQPADRMFAQRTITTVVQKRRASASNDNAVRDQSPPPKRRATMAAVAEVAANPAADGRFHCDKCSKSFDTQLGLSKHAFMHSGFGCSQCNKTLKDAASLKKHMDERHQGGNAVVVAARPRPFVCPQCSSTHLLQSLLYKHMRDDHGINPYGCAQCEQTYGRKAELAAHWKRTAHEGEVQSVQPQQPAMPLPWKAAAASPKTPMQKKGNASGPATPAADGRFACDECGKSFETHHGLLVHAAQHTGIRCTKCRTTLKDAANLAKHMEEHHEGSEDAEDSPRARTIQGERRQMRQSQRHDAATPESTTEDGDESEETEDAAVVTPAADGRFPCDKCERTFDSNLSLQKHAIVHNDIRCKICRKPFRDEARLGKHMESQHKGEENATPRVRPFACPHCPSTHQQHANLKAHLRDDHGINPYGCTECGETFARNAELLTHQRRTEHQGKSDLMGMQPQNEAQEQPEVGQPLQPLDHQEQPAEQPEMEEAVMQPVLEEQPIVEQEQPTVQPPSPVQHLVDPEEESEVMIEEPVEEVPEVVEVQPREMDVIELAD